MSQRNNIMETIDRQKNPEFKLIEKVDILQAREHRLSNGIPVYYVNAGTQELVKMEFLFDAGNWYQPAPLVASTTNALISAGTRDRTAMEIAEQIDYYGAFLETDVNPDNASVSLYSLNKHLKNTLPVLEDILKRAVYPEDELHIYLQNKKQRFLVNAQKVNTIARKKFRELIFGNEHPYGYNVKQEDYDKISEEQILDYYKKYYQAANCSIIVSGKVDDELIELIEKHFGGNDWMVANNASTDTVFQISSDREKKHFIHRDDAMQSAIRIGCPMFNKTHEDAIPMQVLCTILGGYFGSRLMANIREDKGYTYGIGAGIASLLNSGYFFIATEVGVEVCEKAINEIYYELKRLRDEPVPVEELQVVKSYMLGAFQRSADGPFALADKFVNLLEYGLGYDYYDRFVDIVQHIQAPELQQLANKYLREDAMYELVVGKK